MLSELHARRLTSARLGAARVGLLAICAALLVSLSAGDLWAAFAKYRDSGPDGMRLVIAITGDGYTISEQTLFYSDAAVLADAIVATSPWSTFANSINVYLIPMISSESGADKPWLGTYVNTAFDATYGTGGNQQCLTVDYSKVTTSLSGAIPKYDVVVVTVNDSLFGGSGHNAAVTSNHPAATDIILHELGHTFANLEEEYEGNPGVYVGPEPMNPNVTTVTTPSLIKWSAWIDPATLIPTPPAVYPPGFVGLFQGAYTWSQGVYRPCMDCRMRNIGSDFCPVCKEAHVMQAHLHAPLVDVVGPPDGQIDLHDPMDFFAPGNGWQYLTKTWTLDGAQISTGDIVTIHPWQLQKPYSSLTLSIVENTPLIKSYSLWSETHGWTLVPHIMDAMSVAEVKHLPIGYVNVSGVVSAKFTDHFYVQDEDRAGGVRVYPYGSSLPDVGTTVDLCGKREPNNLNLTLIDCQVTVQSGDPEPPEPLGMTNLALGGGPAGLQRGACRSLGTHNVGLLAKIWGRVQVVDPNGEWMTIEDGSPFHTDSQGHPGTRVYGSDMTQYANKHVCVTGICFLDEMPVPEDSPAAVRTRDQNDIVVLDQP